MSADNHANGGQPNSPGKDATQVPRSGSGSDTALEVMIRKRQQGTHGESELLPTDEAPTHPAK